MPTLTGQPATWHNDPMRTKALQLIRAERKRLLKQYTSLDVQIKKLGTALVALGSKAIRPAKTRKMSAAARSKIAAAQRKRWAAWRKKKAQGK